MLCFFFPGDEGKKLPISQIPLFPERILYAHAGQQRIIPFSYFPDDDNDWWRARPQNLLPDKYQKASL